MSRQEIMRKKRLAKLRPTYTGPTFFTRSMKRNYKKFVCGTYHLKRDFAFMLLMEMNRNGSPWARLVVQIAAQIADDAARQHDLIVKLITPVWRSNGR